MGEEKKYNKKITKTKRQNAVIETTGFPTIRSNNLIVLASLVRDS
jgi:hypothetical protein|tara:strand:+ start:371 stop:505 length:135 start_codon:yes stop_codon:yes gene_type:complete